MVRRTTSSTYQSVDVFILQSQKTYSSTRDVQMSVSMTTSGVTTEILRYVEKYSTGSQKFHEIIQSLFQITRMTESDKASTLLKVRPDLDPEQQGSCTT